jgi:hypothetical protein
MNGCFKFFGNILAFFFLVIFLIILPAMVWTFNIQHAIFEPETYEQILGKRAFYNRVLPSMVAGMTEAGKETEHPIPADEVDLPFNPQVFDYLTTDDWETLTELLIPTPWIKGELERNVDALFEWFDGPDIQPDIRFDLAEVKERFGGEEGQQSLDLVVASWPTCSPTESRLVEDFLDGKLDAAEFPACQPEGDLRERLMDDLSGSLVTTAEYWPDYVPDQEEINRALSSAERDQWLGVKFVLRVARRVSYLLFLPPLVLLLLIEIFAVRSFKSLFKWYGWALTLGGLATLFPLLDMLPLAALRGMTAAREAELAFGMAIAINQTFGQPILSQGAALVIIGLVLLAVASQLFEPGDGQFVEKENVQPA